MYKTKPRFPCSMPTDAPLNVLALNASLKHEPAISNTGELASLDGMAELTYVPGPGMRRQNLYRAAREFDSTS